MCIRLFTQDQFLLHKKVSPLSLPTATGSVQRFVGRQGDDYFTYKSMIDKFLILLLPKNGLVNSLTFL